jgi:hypothetical protein
METAKLGSFHFDTVEARDREYNEIVVRFPLYPPPQHHTARIAIEQFDLVS